MPLSEVACGSPMAERGRGAGRTRTWDVARPRGVAWPAGDALGGAREVISRWFATDTAAGRLMPWLPIAFGFGVVLYFTAEREPALWAALVACAASLRSRRSSRARGRSRSRCCSALAAVAAGFATVDAARARASRIRSCSIPPGTSRISGFVEVREERERTDRIVVRVHKIEGRLRDAPERVRLSVKKRMAPPVGAFIEVKARLNPPLRPLRPGGYDFSRDLYFQRIGATGFVARRDQDARSAGAAGRVAALCDVHRGHSRRRSTRASAPPCRAMPARSPPR